MTSPNERKGENGVKHPKYRGSKLNFRPDQKGISLIRKVCPSSQEIRRLHLHVY